MSDSQSPAATELRDIKSFWPKMSDAVQSMIDGLTNLPREDLVVRMGTYSARKGRICFACASTLAFLNAVDNPSLPEHESTWQWTGDRARLWGVDRDELHGFEIALEEFRCGNFHLLCRLYDIPPSDLSVSDWYLDDSDYEDQLPLVQAWVDEIKEMGL